MAVREDQMPCDPLMRMAWVPALSAALGNAEILAAFRADTGERWQPGASPLERMIDDATGAGDAFMSRFVDWFNANVWGDLNEPAFSRQES